MIQSILSFKKVSLWSGSIFLCSLFLATHSAFAVIEKQESYLFTCPISSSQRIEQVVVKEVRVLEANGQFQYFVLDVEAGNDRTTIGEEGQHLKYMQTLVSSQNANTDTFYRTHGDNFQFQFGFGGNYRGSDIKIFLDKTYSGKYVLSLNGSGSLFYNVRDEFLGVLAESEYYRSHSNIECFVHPNIDHYLSL